MMIKKRKLIKNRPVTVPEAGMGAKSMGFSQRDEMGRTTGAKARGLTTGAASVGVFVHGRDFHVERD